MMKLDPLTNFRVVVTQQGLLTNEELDAIDTRTKKLLDDAVAFADSSAYPELSEVDTDVYATV